VYRCVLWQYIIEETECTDNEGNGYTIYQYYKDYKTTNIIYCTEYTKNYICQTNIYVTVFHKVSLCISIDQ